MPGEPEEGRVVPHAGNLYHPRRITISGHRRCTSVGRLTTPAVPAKPPVPVPPVRTTDNPPGRLRPAPACCERWGTPSNHTYASAAKPPGARSPNAVCPSARSAKRAGPASRTPSTTSRHWTKGPRQPRPPRPPPVGTASSTKTATNPDTGAGSCSNPGTRRLPTPSPSATVGSSERTAGPSMSGMPRFPEEPSAGFRTGSSARAVPDSPTTPREHWSCSATSTGPSSPASFRTTAHRPPERAEMTEGPRIAGGVSRPRSGPFRPQRPTALRPRA